MDILTLVLLFFALIETANIMILYFAPQSKKANGTGVFKAFEESKNSPAVHSFIRYLINWVAGTKLIFVMLLLVIALTGDRTAKGLAAGAMILSISTFFWRLYPAIRTMDREGWISPEGYSKTLLIMIALFILLFAGALFFSS